jgi:hypothetical protein
MDKTVESVGTDHLMVRVWGMDCEGRPFFQNANAEHLTIEGALLVGINHPLKAGDVIGVQFEEKKARFKVLEVVSGGSLRKLDAHVQVFPGQRTPWHDLANPAKKPEFIPGNKRKYTRHKLQFPLEISFEDARRTHINTSATDIGGCGCYVETLIPLPLGTRVHIVFWIDEEKVKTSGLVRASDPGVGMGIEFTDLDNHVQEQLQAHLDKIEVGFASGEAAKGASNQE